MTKKLNEYYIGEIMTDKKYPDDYTPEQQELIKEIVIERIKRLPDNFRISMGRKIEDE